MLCGNLSTTEPFREPVPWKALGELRCCCGVGLELRIPVYNAAVDAALYSNTTHKIDCCILEHILIGLTDYPILIPNPMDLGTIKKKIKNKEYTSLLQCGEDVKLIWKNCMTYNADGSDFYKLAQSLYKRWDSQYTKFLNDIGAMDTATTGGSQPSSAKSSSNIPTNSTSNGGNGTQPQHATDRKVTLQEKRNLAKSFYQLSKEDLGKVLIEIEKRTPAAIKRNAAEDELDLIMDAIDVPTMIFLNTMVNEYVIDDTHILDSWNVLPNKDIS